MTKREDKRKNLTDASYHRVTRNLRHAMLTDWPTLPMLTVEYGDQTRKISLTEWIMLPTLTVEYGDQIRKISLTEWIIQPTLMV